MQPHINHLTDVNDSRPTYGVLYRRESETRNSYVRIQADSPEDVMQLFTSHVGDEYYAFLSIRQIP